MSMLKPNSTSRMIAKTIHPRPRFGGRGWLAGIMTGGGGVNVGGGGGVLTGGIDSSITPPK
ncbi:MAG TPA: hypothetical protein VKV04_23300 [Verrucomicrobiae bacterium]|nr:hypothetical protein [Verrucomicrobiae bacterium]